MATQLRLGAAPHVKGAACAIEKSSGEQRGARLANRFHPLSCPHRGLRQHTAIERTLARLVSQVGGAADVEQ
eukprot:607823-Alexandrium_andersonii.AAC.1